MTENLPAPAPEPSGEILLYQSEDGTTRIEVRLECDTVWLPQRAMAELFQTTKQNISLHIQHIFEEGELRPEATVKQYLTVQTEGKRQIRRPVDHYSLDVIIAVGYRVKSRRGTQFRVWATLGSRFLGTTDILTKTVWRKFWRPTFSGCERIGRCHARSRRRSG